MRYVALLRGVNVGGRTLVSMAELRALSMQHGFAEVATLLQSGNLVFAEGKRDAVEIERVLESAAEKELGLKLSVLVRSAPEWRRIIAGNPHDEAAKHDPGHLLVLFLKNAPAAKAWKALESAITGPEIVSGKKRHAYVVYPAGIGRSKLTNAVIEAKLATRVTGRNWNTALKLAAMLED